MLRKMMPATLTAAAMMLAPLPALAHGAQGGDSCCEEGGHGEKAKAGDDCCAAEGPKAHAEGDACEDCDEGGEHGMGMKGPRGMHGEMGMHGGMHGHGMMGHGKMAGLSFNHELRYMPMMGTSTNQWLVLGSGMDKRFTEWFDLGWQHNLALQTFNTSNNGFWVAPYCGIVPKVGYGVGAARLDVGALVGAGAMARTTQVGGLNDVLQARLMWVVEPRAELTWVGDEWSYGLVGTYLTSQYLNDFGGFSIGLKASWGPHGHGMPRKGMMEHKDHGMMDDKKSMDKCEDCEEHEAPKPHMAPAPAPKKR